MSSNQQLINFADKELMSSITASSITVDGYEVDNLIRKRQSFHQQSSFLCEYYMKCPVEVILTFPCLVDISYIVIEPKVSTHRSKEIELFTIYQAPMVPDRTKVNKEPNRNEVDTALYPCCFPKDFADSKVRQIYQSSFNFSGKYNEPPGLEQTPERLIFANPMNPQSPNLKTGDFLVNLNSVPSTRCCSHLLVKIKWATVPALRSLQVWGTFSSRNTKFVAREFGKLLKINKIVGGTAQSKNASKKSEKDIPADKGITVRNSKEKTCTVNENEIPPEFLDPITFALMKVPMMLPSGNTVDKATLEKYVIEEEKYGRLPSDPFTGVVFQGSKTPIPNTSLKARIDEFLLRNTHLYKDGATTGYRNNASLKTLDNLKEIIPSSSRTEKRKSELSNATVSKKNCVSISTGNQHHDDMKNSLNLALGKILPNLPSSSRNKSNKLKCSKCEDVDYRNLFKLPCCHICCRKCMEASLFSTKMCVKCNKGFERIDVIKLTAT